MGVGYILVNETKRETIAWFHMSANTAWELVMHPDAAAVTQWYMLRNIGDRVSFVTDSYDDWPFEESSRSELASFKDVTDETIAKLIESNFLEEHGRLYEDEDEPEAAFIRDLRRPGWRSLDGRSAQPTQPGVDRLRPGQAFESTKGFYDLLVSKTMNRDDRLVSPETANAWIRLTAILTILIGVIRTGRAIVVAWGMGNAVTHVGSGVERATLADVISQTTTLAESVTIICGILLGVSSRRLSGWVTR